MKKLFLLFLAVVMMLGFSSCENQGEARAIVGHSYQMYNSASDWETLYFSPSGTVQLTFCNQGTTSSYTHLTYKIQNCNVEVYYDYSDFWKDTARGQLLGAFSYLPDQDCLIGSNNGVYYRLH